MRQPAPKIDIEIECRNSHINSPNTLRYPLLIIRPIVRISQHICHARQAMVDVQHHVRSYIRNSIMSGNGSDGEELFAEFGRRAVWGRSRSRLVQERCVPAVISGEEHYHVLS